MAGSDTSNIESQDLVRVLSDVYMYDKIVNSKVYKYVCKGAMLFVVGRSEYTREDTGHRIVVFKMMIDDAVFEYRVSKDLIHKYLRKVT